MLAYMCKNCRQFTTLGYVNKFNEHFCSQECYKKYCEKNNYEYNPEDIKLVENALTK